MWDIRGQDRPRDLLRGSIARDRLGQSYLFVGPPGIGKKRFALAFAQTLLCETVPASKLDPCGVCNGCRQVLVRSHPDLVIVEKPVGKSEIPIDLLIGSSDNRGHAGFCHDLSLKPMAGGRKVAILDDADALNEEGANSLLKILEEPPPHSLIILVAPAADALLPTIRSRCQQLPFSPLPERDVAELLVLHEFTDDAEQAQSAALLSGGSLEMARQLLEPALREQRDLLYATLSKRLFSAGELAKQLVAGVEKSGTAASVKRQHAGWIVQFAVEFFRQSIRAISLGEASVMPQVGEFVSRFAGVPADLDLLGELLDRSMQTAFQLEGNAAVPLCLEAWMSDLARELRPEKA